MRPEALSGVGGVEMDGGEDCGNGGGTVVVVVVVFIGAFVSTAQRGCKFDSDSLATEEDDSSISLILQVAAASLVVSALLLLLDVVDEDEWRLEALALVFIDVFSSI